jgi:hypothetical protein
MNYSDREPMIAAAADEALEADRKSQLEAHVRECEVCRQALADQRLVRTVLASTPPVSPSSQFLARVNARIDETAGWFGLTDFRAWTFRLVPAAAALGLFAWLGTATTATPVPSPTFSPASALDWQSDVPADALLDAAMRTSAGEPHVR